ncbi:unnamed protein product [Auanema sp. JU1783]|nr:unnamed protein product [Auanema sp. JU1783]
MLRLSQVIRQCRTACNNALINYVKKLETKTLIEIIPQQMVNSMTYDKLSELFILIVTKVDKDTADSLHHGWAQAYYYHTEGWVENDLTLEDVEDTFPSVLRFLEIFDKQLKVDNQMALYLKENLFDINLDEHAIQTNKDSENEKVDQIL